MKIFLFLIMCQKRWKGDKSILISYGLRREETAHTLKNLDFGTGILRDTFNMNDRFGN